MLLSLPLLRSAGLQVIGIAVKKAPRPPHGLAAL
jgi:hypothetical protein